MHHVPGIFMLHQCLDCGLIYQNPRPTRESFPIIYPDEYEPHQPVTVTPTTLHPDWIYTCKLIQQQQPGGGRLLDVGCGPGTFMMALRQLEPRWETVGIEPDPRAAALARQQHLQIENSDLETATLTLGSFDAVTLWNVLEHLPDPLESLRCIHKLLRPDGMLYLAVPLCDSWDARLFGRYWLGWELPRHFVIFNRATLQTILAQAGFEIIQTACLSGVEFCFTESLRLFLKGRVQRYAVRRLSIAVTYSRPFRLFLKPSLCWAKKAGRTTVLTVAARSTDK
jgi:SAM-dependent methyltransferase